MSALLGMMCEKKEQIMYATIKGTLTENNGVFSGFSASNYLKLQQQLDTSKPFEIKVKFSITSLTTSIRSIVGVSIGGLFEFMINASNNPDAPNALRFTCGKTSNFFDICNIYTQSNFIQVDKTYYAKAIYTGTQYELWTSEDDTTWSLVGSQVSTYLINNGNPLYLQIGDGHTQHWSFTNGSIDLNQSYIKLGSTKYNLQAVVGYTIVGSPTITDGVVSGFTMSDYLRINGNITDNFSSIEFCVVFTTPNTLSNQPITSSTSTWNNDSLFSLSSGGQNLSFNIKNGVSMACNLYILQPNTKYKGVLKRNNGIYTLSLYSGDTTLLDSVSLENSSYLWNGGSSAIIFGKDTPLWNSYFKGSIDIANSYIKINNKLWFNGQQA